MGYLFEEAPGDQIFILTEHGYEITPDHVKPERAVGNPVKGFEKRVPRSWVHKGYVVLK